MLSNLYKTLFVIFTGLTRECKRLVYNFEYHVKSHCKTANFCKCCFLLVKIEIKYV